MLEQNEQNSELGPVFSPEFLKKLELRHQNLGAQRAGDQVQNSENALPLPIEILKKILTIEEFIKVAANDSFIWKTVNNEANDSYVCYLLRRGNTDFIEILKPTILKMLKQDKNNFFEPLAKKLIENIAEYANTEASFALFQDILDVILEKHPEWIFKYPGQAGEDTPLSFALRKNNIHMIEYWLNKFRSIYPNLSESLKRNAFIKLYVIKDNNREISLYELALEKKLSSVILKLLYQHLVILFSSSLTEAEIEQEFAKLYPNQAPSPFNNCEHFSDYVTGKSGESRSGPVIIEDVEYLKPCLQELISFHLNTAVEKSKKYATMRLKLNGADTQAYLEKISAANTELLQRIETYLSEKGDELETQERQDHKRIFRNFFKALKLDNTSKIGIAYRWLMQGLDLTAYGYWCYYTDYLLGINESLGRDLKQNYPEQMCRPNQWGDWCLTRSWHCYKQPYAFTQYQKSDNQAFKSAYEECNQSYVDSTLSMVSLVLVAYSACLGILSRRQYIKQFSKLEMAIPGNYSNYCIQTLMIKPIIWMLGNNTTVVDKESLIGILTAINDFLLDIYKDKSTQEMLNNNKKILATPLEDLRRDQLNEMLHQLLPWLEKRELYEKWWPEELELPQEVLEKIAPAPEVIATGNINNCQQFQQSLLDPDLEKGNLADEPKKCKCVVM